MKTSNNEEKLLNRVTELEKELAKANSKIEALDITERKQMEEALEKRIVALTQPMDSSAGITFEELFNMGDIQRLQDQFSDASGVASIITQTDGTPITKPSNFCRLCSDIIRKTDKGLKNCFKSDAALGHYNPKGPSIQPCLSGGLWDAGAAITVGGKHIANWLIGQVRDATQTDDKMRAYANEIEADEETVIKAFHEVPAMTREQFEKVSQALFTLAKQLSDMAYQNMQQARFITERKQAEETLRESEAKFRSYIENAPNGIFITDEKGNYLEVNEAAAKITGYSKDE
ncbi:MAG: PocR ligand-binding domain-containing protein, partial [Labilibaculum sp.]